MFKSAVLILVLCFQLSSRAHTVSACSTATSECESVFELGPNAKVKYTRSFDLNISHLEVTSAVLMIHASDRVVSWGYKQLNSLMAQGLLSEKTLVVAPLLPTSADRPGKDYLYWGANDWSAGHNSLDQTHTSSFQVIDQLIRQILGSGNFPNLKKIIITGFSAGGQATQRFAVGTEVDHEFPGVQFRFIVGSPSSYVYLNDDRWVPGTEYQFAVPTNPTCAYNNYRYGGDRRNSYMSRKDFATLRENFLKRDLVFIVGEIDDATTHPNPPIPHDIRDSAGLDISCEAGLQGRSRVERSFLFHQYLVAEFPSFDHVWISVPEVAHSYRVYDDLRVIDLLNWKPTTKHLPNPD